MDQPTIRTLDELAAVVRVHDQSVLVRVEPVRRDRIWVATVRRRIWCCGRIPSHVRPMLAGIGRAHHTTAVRAEAVLAVLIRSADVDLVWMTRRTNDQVVVDALRCAVVECSIVRVGTIGTSLTLPGGSIVRPVKESARGLSGVIRAIQGRAGWAVGPIASVDSGLSIR